MEPLIWYQKDTKEKIARRAHVAHAAGQVGEQLIEAEVQGH